MWYPSQQQNSTDQVANFFWLMILFFGLSIVAWWVKPSIFVVPVFWLRIHEIEIINVVIAIWAKIAVFLHLPIPETQTLNQYQDYMRKSVNHVPFSQFSLINQYMGRWIRFPVATVLVGLGILTLIRHGTFRFHEKYNMDQLRKVEAQNWPQITPVLSKDLVGEDVDKGSWAMAKLPLNFCKEQNLLATKEVEGKTRWTLLRGPAARALAMQLGPLWKGVRSQPIHIKALLAIFIARAEKDRVVSKHLISQIAASAVSGQLDFTGAEELLLKYENANILKWVEKRHAYVYTVMATLLEIGRSDGILATAEFLWLKPLDRRLWYVLNSIGRQTAVVEAAGPFAHWLAEKKLGRALKTPTVKEAVNGLEQAIEETLYITEGDKWHINNAA